MTAYVMDEERCLQDIKNNQSQFRVEAYSEIMKNLYAGLVRMLEP